MGQEFTRTCQACCDPEGTAAIVRKKKAQRAAINKYTELLQRFEQDMGSGNDGGIRQAKNDLRQADNEYKNKGDGNFWKELVEHKDWPPIAKQRQDLESRAGP